MSGLQAVADLGTHSCLLLVGRADASGELDVVLDVCEIPRMGEGLDRTGKIGAAALVRVEGVLREYLRKTRELGCAELVVGGTAALRRASNQGEVMQRLAGLEEPGVRLRIELIAEADEARYGWLAAAGGEAATCVLDVGGGSTEVVAAGGALMRSAPLGAVVLTERLGHLGWDAMLAEARLELACLRDTDTALDPAAPWVALGGTPSNLASLEMGLAAFDHLAVEGVLLGSDRAAMWGQRLAVLSLDERCKLPIEAARAEVLPAGLACMAAGFELFGPPKFRVTGRGLRYGFLSAMLKIR